MIDINTETTRLREKYPLLFLNEGNDLVSCYGIECHVGWLYIIESVFDLLYTEYNSCMYGLNYWTNQLTIKGAESTEAESIKKHIDDYNAKLILAKNNLPKIEQVKQKFGTLRIYTSTYNDYIRGVIDMAERMSEITCEYCGANGRIYKQGWHMVLCEQHAIEKGKIKKTAEEGLQTS